MNEQYAYSIENLAKLASDATVMPSQVLNQASFVRSSKTHRSIACSKIIVTIGFEKRSINC